MPGPRSLPSMAGRTTHRDVVRAHATLHGWTRTELPRRDVFWHPDRDDISVSYGRLLQVTRADERDRRGDDRPTGAPLFTGREVTGSRYKLDRVLAMLNPTTEGTTPR